MEEGRTRGEKKIVVTVGGAHLNPQNPEDIKGGYEVHAELTVEGITKETTHKPLAYEVEWKESFTFELSEPFKKDDVWLELRLKTKNARLMKLRPGSGELLGSAIVPLSEARSHAEKHQWFPISHEGGSVEINILAIGWGGKEY